MKYCPTNEVVTITQGKVQVSLTQEDYMRLTKFVEQVKVHNIFENRKQANA